LNAQNWEFIVVKDREVVAKLARLNRRAMNLVTRFTSAPLNGAVTRRCSGYTRPCNGRRITSKRSPSSLWHASRGHCTLAVDSYQQRLRFYLSGGANLLLAARAAGLGTALITAPLWSKLLARRALGLPWNVTPCAVIPLGWPIGQYGPTTRRPVGELVLLDRYGNRAFL
jgi:nitroreductase